jgi:hypothetical protein
MIYDDLFGFLLDALLSTKKNGLYIFENQKLNEIPQKKANTNLSLYLNIIIVGKSKTKDINRQRTHCLGNLIFF